MLKSIELLFSELHKNDILYCHWKSNEHLDESFEGDTDLDMLFLPEQRNKLNIILETLNLKRFRATSFMQYNGIEDYIGFDKETAKIWHLHLHYRLTLGGNHLKGYTFTSWPNLLLQNRVLYKNVYVSSPIDELILLYVRMALKLTFTTRRRKISADDQKEIYWLKQSVGLNVFSSRCDAFGLAESKKALISLFSQDIHKRKELSKLSKSLKKELKVFSGMNSFQMWNLRMKRTFSWALGAIKRKRKKNNTPYRRVSPVGGSVIAFLGADGAGKSTTIKYVYDELNKKIDVKVVYLGSGDGDCSIFRRPLRFVARKVGGKGVGHTMENQLSDKKKKPSFKAKLYEIAKIWWAMSLANEKKKKLKKITKYRNLGMIVLTDRYPQTNIYGYSDGPLLHKYLELKKGFRYRTAVKEDKIYSLFNLNVPDLMIKLLVPPEVSISRKPEMTLEEIVNKSNAVKQCNNALKIVEIDSSVDKNVSFGNVLEAIWAII